MATVPYQFTHDFIVLERELVRLRREFVRFRRDADETRTDASPVARIAAMQLPVGRWEDMEQEIHGNGTR